MPVVTGIGGVVGQDALSEVQRVLQPVALSQLEVGPPQSAIGLSISFGSSGNSNEEPDKSSSFMLSPPF